MKHMELIERLRLLSEGGRAIDTALIAPGLAGRAAIVVSEFSHRKRLDNENEIITCQDLREFLDWLIPIIANENRRQELLRHAQFSNPGYPNPDHHPDPDACKAGS